MATKAENSEVTVPVPGFQFTVHTDPNASGYDFLPDEGVGFTEVSGLSDTTEVNKYKEGNDGYTKSYPGMTTPGEVTLRRGLDRNNKLLVWRNAVKERTQLPNRDYKCTCYITIYERTGAPGAFGEGNDGIRVTVWKYTNAWPSELSLSDLSAGNGEITTQSVTLQYDGAAEQVFPAF